MKRPRQPHTISAIITGVMLTFALHMNREGASAMAIVLMGLVGCSLAWSLVMLGQRLRAAGGLRELWHPYRTSLFWIIGLANTLFQGQGEIADWRYWLGCTLLVLAVADTIWLLQKERRVLEQSSLEFER